MVEVLEHTLDLIRLEEPCVGPERKPVRMRMNVVAEISHVIPDVQTRRDFRPFRNVGRERGIRRIAQRLAKIALDRAQPNNDILLGLNCLRRLARVLVSEGIHCHSWKLGFDLLRDVIGEGNHGSRVAPLGIVERFAIRTLAMAVPIVLRDRDDLAIRALAEPFLDLLNHKVPQLRIREAKLSPLGRAFSLDQAVPFRVFGEVFVRQHQRIKRVAKSFVLDATSKRSRNDIGFIIPAIARFPQRVQAAKPIRSAIFETWPAPNVQVRNFQRRLMRDIRGPWRPPSNAALILRCAAGGWNRIDTCCTSRGLNQRTMRTWSSKHLNECEPATNF